MEVSTNNYHCKNIKTLILGSSLDEAFVTLAAAQAFGPRIITSSVS